MKALAEGFYIKHFQYGLGVVTDSDSERTSIDFDLHGLKKFVTSIMVVEAAEANTTQRARAKRKKKITAAILTPAVVAAETKPPALSMRAMADTPIIQFVGYEVLPLVREYKFTVRESKTVAHANSR